MILRLPIPTLFPYTTLFRSVTTAWWDDIWLNEAFATWMATKIIEGWKPEWKEKLGAARSEEHTSELQSLTNLVCRLLLEKKKKSMNQTVEQRGEKNRKER